MSRVALLTGATGFVGSHTASAFVEAGWRVRCTVRAASDPRWLEGLDVDLREAELDDDRRLEDALRGAEVAVHAAGVTRAADPDLFRIVNVEGTRRVAAAAARAGCRRLVFVSSLAARGPDGASGPESAYGRSKREAEEVLAGRAVPLEVVVLRPAGVYGPRDPDMAPLFRWATRGWLPVPAAGPEIQPVYVTDAAAAALRAAEADAPGFGPHPVAEPGRYGWDGVRRALEAATGRRVRALRVPGLLYELAGLAGEVAGRMAARPPAFDRRRARDLARHEWTCEVAGTERALGWRAEVALPEGLRRTLTWYRARGWV